MLKYQLVFQNFYVVFERVYGILKYHMDFQNVEVVFKVFMVF